jgi:pimeloyl-ACP methyl ester carboxylesterase
MEHKSNDFPEIWIFLRGLTRGAFHWLGFEKKFQDFFKVETVYTPDLAGNGVLFDETSNTDIDQAVEQIRSQIPSESLKKKVGLFTISMGGMIGTRWAEMYPDEISHLVLVNSSFSSISPFYRRLRPRNYPAVIKNFFYSSPASMEDFILRATSNFEEKWKPQFQEFVEFQRTHPVTIGNFMRQLRTAGKAKFSAKPQAEILILTSQNDHLVNYQCSLDLANAWNAPIEIHSTAGHDLPLDDGDWILQKMLSRFSV